MHSAPCPAALSSCPRKRPHDDTAYRPFIDGTSSEKHHGVHARPSLFRPRTAAHLDRRTHRGPEYFAHAVKKLVQAGPGGTCRRAVSKLNRSWFSIPPEISANNLRALQLIPRETLRRGPAPSGALACRARLGAALPPSLATHTSLTRLSMTSFFPPGFDIGRTLGAYSAAYRARPCGSDPGQKALRYPHSFGKVEDCPSLICAMLPSSTHPGGGAAMGE